MKPIIYLSLIGVASLFSACNKFLDVTPQGVLIPEKVSDYEAMLNSPALTRTFQSTVLYAADDYYNTFGKLDATITANTYFWRQQLDIDVTANPVVWGNLYRSIYNTNAIINQVMDATEGTLLQKQQTLAEALTVRAECYFNLLTVFAKAYDPATAADLPGLPLVTSTNVTDAIPQRSSLKATMDSIINDLKKATAHLPVTSINRYRVTRYAAYGMLTRVSMYTGDYTAAITYADSALKATHSFLNYNNYTGSTLLPVDDLNPEVLWQRGIGDVILNLPSTDDLKNNFNSDDLRAVRFSLLPGTTINYPIPRSLNINFPEIYLSKAEALVRINEDNITEAMDLVNLVRSNRIKTDAYTPETAATQEEALAKVLLERRKELAFKGTRWMDMKRFDKEGRMPEVTRTDKTTGEVLAILAPKSAAYTFEIPARVLLFNPEMKTNH